MAGQPGPQPKEISTTLDDISGKVFETIPIGLVILDAHGVILNINGTALEAFDIDLAATYQAAAGNERARFLDLLPPGEQDRWAAMLNLVLTTGHHIIEPRFYHHTKYLEKVLSLKMQPLTSGSHDREAMVLVAEDITERVTIEQYVILSEKLVARGDMAGALAHELNNFLAMIGNNAELMAINLERDKPAKAAFNARAVSEHVMQAKAYLENLVDFSRVESEYILYDMRRLVDDLLFSLRLQPRFKPVHFTISLPEQIPLIEMDVSQIQQTILNLLDNASDSLEAKAATWPGDPADFRRQIEVSARFDDEADTVTVEITDGGTGIASEDLEKIFSRHFTTKKGSHGLGLYNGRAAAKRHGGTLTAESKPGIGARFILTLPRQLPARDTSQ